MKILCCLLSFLSFAYHCSAQHECDELAKKAKISKEDFAKDFVGKQRYDHLTWVYKDTSFDEHFEYCSPVSFGSACTNSFVVYEATQSTDNEPFTFSFNFYNKTNNETTPYTFLSWNATSINSTGLVFQSKKNDVKVFKWYSENDKVEKNGKDEENGKVEEINNSNWPASFKEHINDPFVLFYTDYTKGLTIFTLCKGPKSWVLINREVAEAYNGVSNLQGQIQKKLLEILNIKNMQAAYNGVAVEKDIKFKEKFQNNMPNFNFVKEKKPSKTEEVSNPTTAETTESKPRA